MAVAPFFPSRTGYRSPLMCLKDKPRRVIAIVCRQGTCNIRACACAANAASVWFDSAGPAYLKQIKGLPEYGLPPSTSFFGTVGTSVTCCETTGQVGTDARQDFPSAPAHFHARSVAALDNASFQTAKMSARSKASVEDLQLFSAGYHSH